MKIIRLTTFLNFGGVEKRLINISNVRDSNEWIFYAINKGGTAAEQIKKQNKQVVCLDLTYKIPQISTIYKLYQVFKREKPDVVHTSGAEANFHGVIAAKLAGVRVVVAEEIGIPSQGFLAKKIFQVIYQMADFAVGNSKLVTRFLRDMNGVADTKLVLIPNPMIFPDLPAIKKTIEAEFNIISVSRLEPVKNIESVLRAVSRLIADGIKIKYTIIGDGASADLLKNLVLSLGIENNIIFAGFHADPYPFLLKSDLYVLTSFSEGFSNSLMEAMFSGIPSLSTKVGAAEEIIDDGINGWLVEPNDDDDLLKKLKLIVQLTEEERTQIGVSGKKTITDNYSLQNHIDLLMELYLKKVI